MAAYLIPLLVLAIVLDVLIVRGLRRFRQLQADRTDQDGNLVASQWTLLWRAFFAVRKNRFQHRSPLSPPWSGFAWEWLLIVLVAYIYCGAMLLILDRSKLQQTGEHNASATLPMLAEIGLKRHGEIPLWNPYMLTGFPHSGDPLAHFWNPVSTIPIMIFGGINGMKVSIFLSFIIAGWGQWLFAHVMRLRRVFRLWSAILFMLSGGLVLLWRIGWYELLLGVVWFPWCFALYLAALRQHSLPSIFYMSIVTFMVLSSGGGYYPFYLAACLLTILVVTFIPAARQERIRQAQTSMFILICTAALAAVILVPYAEVHSAYIRDVHLDLQQQYSQPIEYGLINYVIYTPDWFYENILGTAAGWNWFYIGWLPIAALAFIPVAFSRSPRLRRPILVSGMLFLVLMMWFANRFTVFEKIFDWIPFLYTLRFPNRLLIVATSPLLILAALGLEHAYRLSRAVAKNLRLAQTLIGRRRGVLLARFMITSIWVVGLIATTARVYDVNQGFGFINQNFDPQPLAALSWLKNYDSSLYYVNIGGGAIDWDWTATAYDLEVPMINFLYSRHLRTQDMQRNADSPFAAQAKYQISLPKEAVPENAQQINNFNGMRIWKVPDVLPYAFSVGENLIQQNRKLAENQVTSINVRLNGPNQVVASGAPISDGDMLIILMSHFPGWKLLIDGHPAEVIPVNGYLGAKMLPGVHTYQFYFLPTSFIMGAVISAIAWLTMIAAVSISPLRSAMRRLVRARIQVASPNATT